MLEYMIKFDCTKIYIYIIIFIFFLSLFLLENKEIGEEIKNEDNFFFLVV
jgi:hypothetical protein